MKIVHWLIQSVALVVGLVLLIPFCLLEAWEPCTSSEGPYPPHIIDRWKWHLLNKVYGNPEDGVSGQHALIWDDAGHARIPYRPNTWAPLRAWLWSAWRNSVDQLKYTYGG